MSTRISIGARPNDAHAHFVAKLSYHATANTLLGDNPILLSC